MAPMGLWKRFKVELDVGRWPRICGVGLYRRQAKSTRGKLKKKSREQTIEKLEWLQGEGGLLYFSIAKGVLGTFMLFTNARIVEKSKKISILKVV